MDRTELMLEAGSQLIDSINTLIAKLPIFDSIKMLSAISGRTLGNLVNLGSGKNPDVKDCFSDIAISVFHEHYDDAMK